jgi:phytoene/squalene synthetase
MKNQTDIYLEKIDFENIEKHPNILIAARFWDDRRFRAAKVCYKFMRMIDDLIDDRKALGQEIGCLEKEELGEKVKHWIDCLDKGMDHDPFYMELAETISTFRIPLQIFQNFAKSMFYDIDHDGFATLDRFMEYAEGASVAPASVFVHLCCLTEGNGSYTLPGYDIVEAARPCAIFSYLVHIIRDFQEDQLANLNYFALDVLEKHHLTPADLKEIAHGAPVTEAFREVIREYCELAQKYSTQTINVIKDLSSVVNGRYLLSLHVIYNLYRMVFDRIDIEKGTFTTQELNPTPLEIKKKVLEIASGW